MIRFPAAVKIYVCIKPTDMRKSFDGLCGITQQVIEQDPQSGHLFVFRNKARDRLKILWWDHDGLVIFYKRLESGTFQLPTDVKPADENLASTPMTVNELNILLGGIDFSSVKHRKRYQLPAKPLSSKT